MPSEDYLVEVFNRTETLEVLRQGTTTLFSLTILTNVSFSFKVEPTSNTRKCGGGD